MDPNSGTAIMAEVARAMKQAQNDGVFKPLRSVMFCAWDAEEYGLMVRFQFNDLSVTFVGLKRVC
jgi:N-acetylated-alpha-linked acidic dipeptidase